MIFQLQQHPADLLQRLVAMAMSLLLASCINQGAPEQSQFLEIGDLMLQENWYEDAFARLYKRPVYIEEIERIASHPWVVVKRPYSDRLIRIELDRYTSDDEVLCAPFDPYDPGDYWYQECGHVSMSVFTGFVSQDDWLVLGELRGVEAEAVVEFAYTQVAGYPCKGFYYWLDRNSNTFIRWFIEMTDWDVTLGPSSFGQEHWQKCVG